SLDVAPMNKRAGAGAIQNCPRATARTVADLEVQLAAAVGAVVGGPEVVERAVVQQRNDLSRSCDISHAASNCQRTGARTAIVGQRAADEQTELDGLNPGRVI